MAKTPTNPAAGKKATPAKAAASKPAAAPVVAAPVAPPVAPPPAKDLGRAPVVNALIVTAKVEGFRRAGRAWSKAPETVSAGELSDAQIEALLAEQMLDVVVVAE